MAEPWDVPRTVEGREQLKALMLEYRKKGMTRELGICCSRMANLIKHVGAEKGAAMEEAASFGAQAVRYLRKAEDKKELARALRASAIPFVEDLDYKAVLEEALAIFRDLGESEEEAWTIFRMSGWSGVPGYTEEMALEIFKECGSLEGEATCLLRIGFTRKPMKPRMIERAAQLFEQAGNERETERATIMLKLALSD